MPLSAGPDIDSPDSFNTIRSYTGAPVGCFLSFASCAFVIAGLASLSGPPSILAENRRATLRKMPENGQFNGLSQMFRSLLNRRNRVVEPKRRPRKKNPPWLRRIFFRFEM